MSWQAEGGPVASGGRDDRLLLWNSVRQIAGISRTTAWRMQRSGDFPNPVAISPKRVGWWESELTAWKASRKSRELPMPTVGDRYKTLQAVAPDDGASMPSPEGEVAEARPKGAIRRGRAARFAPEQADFGF